MTRHTLKIEEYHLISIQQNQRYLGKQLARDNISQKKIIFGSIGSS